MLDQRDDVAFDVSIGPKMGGERERWLLLVDTAEKKGRQTNVDGLGSHLCCFFFKDLDDSPPPPNVRSPPSLSFTLLYTLLFRSPFSFFFFFFTPTADTVYKSP